MSNEIRSKYYRISAKALVLNEARDAFLITKETNGLWELPGGGLEWGETPQLCITREIKEEMSIDVTSVANTPSYFLTVPHKNSDSVLWVANVLYETTLTSLDFRPSDECVDTAFVNESNAHEFDLFPNVTLLLEQFDPKKHVA
jgi:8-oxo-dGTP diphosphatase